MDPANTRRNPVDRSAVMVAVVSVIIGLYMLLQALLAHREGLGGAAWIFGVPALLFFALAIPVYRGSDDAKLAVVGILMLLMLISVLAVGFASLFPWQALMAALLWVAMRGGFMQENRWPRRAGRRR